MIFLGLCFHRPWQSPTCRSTPRSRNALSPTPSAWLPAKFFLAVAYLPTKLKTNTNVSVGLEHGLALVRRGVFHQPGEEKLALAPHHFLLSRQHSSFLLVGHPVERLERFLVFALQRCSRLKVELTCV